MQKAHDASKNNWWENLPSIATPIVAEELNRNETSVDAIDDRVVTFDTTKANQTDLLLAVKSISFDKNTGIFTITKFNNTSTTIDTDIEKIAINFDYDDDPTSPHYQHLVITLDDGTVKYVDMSALVTQYDFSDSAQIHFTNTSGTISATIINGSITEEKLQPNFLADCRAAKTAAETAEANAQSSEEDSEAWAVGERNGVPVPSTDETYHNNAKYWASQANVTSLVALTDVDINYPKSGEVLTFNGNMWENREFFSPEDITVTDSFESYTGGRVKSVQMELSPIQDLHGYDSPWVGGANKNKLPLVLADIKANNVSGTWNGNVYSKDGIDFTILTDDADNVLGINANGTATSQVGITVAYYAPISAGSYILNGTASGSGWTTSWLNINVDGTNYNDIGSGASFTVSANTTFRTFCYIANGATVSNKVFLPMIRLSTESDPTFAPYSNVCPISAHTQAKLEQRGKNLLPNIIETRSTHSFWVGQSSGSIYPFRFEKDKTYVISFDSNYSTSSMYYVESGGADTEIGRSGSTFTPSKDMDVDLWIYGGGLSEVSNVQIELGSSATDYEPYQGKDYIINLGGSYYWVRGDVVSGKWYVVGQSVDLGTLTWAKGSASYYAGVSGIKIQTNQSQKMNAYCSSYKISAQSEQEYSTISGLNWGAYIAFWNLVDYSDANQVKTAMSGVQLVYELATPIPINLNPQQIEAFLGENNFSAPLEQQEIIEIIARNIAEFNEVIDDENISDEFTYSSEKIEDRLDEYVDKDAVEEKSATDEFTTINGGLLSSLKVALSPNQDLHGYDSPWVGGSRKNKAILEQGTLDLSDGSESSSTTRVRTNFISVQSGQTYIASSENNGWSVRNGCTYDANKNFISSGVWPDSDGTIIIPSGVSYVRFIYSHSDTSETCTPDDYWYQFELGSTATAYEPYSNICPISGHTQVEVEVGTNKLNPDNIVQGSLTTSALSTRCSTRGNLTIPISVGQTITVSRQSATINYAVAVTDSSMSVLFDSGWQSESYTYVSAYNGYVELVFAKQDGTDITPSNVKSANFMVEFGSTPSPYVPYAKGTYSLTVNLGGTYYSGTLDVVSGVLTVDKVGKDMTTITDWNINTSAQRIYKVLSDIKPTSSGTEIPNLISNRFKAISVNDIYSYVQGVAVSTGSALQFHINGLTDRNDVTLAEVNQWFVDNPTLVVYELATPTTIQLSPTMVKALVGENHLSAPLEGQEITESKYRELFTWDEVSGVTDSLDSRVDTLEINASKITWSSSVSKAIDDTTCTIQDPKITTSSIIEPFYSNVSGDNVVIKNQTATAGQVVLTFDALLEATSFRVRITNL